MPFCKMILVFVRGLMVSRAKLSLELLALRHQLEVLRRTVQRPPDSESGQEVLDFRLTNLEGLAASLDHRQARDSDQMASPGLQDVLALEVPIEPSRTSQAG